jgi:tRNA(Ile)-lysidine synthase TilS/MesJ
MKFCTRCVLPETFPAIEFDGHGVCNYCLHTPLADDAKKKEYLKKFEDLLDDVRGKREYDAIMAYSGGKDSTYTMYHLAVKYRLKILACTFDNGFISPKALENISRMTDAVCATGMVVRPPFRIMKKVFAATATEDIYSPKTLDRASSLCTSCISHVKSIVLKTALRMNIPLVAYGWSPGQAPITSAIMQTGPKLQRISHRTGRDPLMKHFGKDLEPYFLSEKDLEIDAALWPINIHPLAFMDYDEAAILRLIRSIGWEKPEDTDPNSTNCILNALANYLHRKRFRFHPYAWEIAGIVRSGSMSRDEGIEKTTQEEDMAMVRFAADKLGLAI